MEQEKERDLEFVTVKGDLISTSIAILLILVGFLALKFLWDDSATVSGLSQSLTDRYIK